MGALFLLLLLLQLYSQKMKVPICTLWNCDQVHDEGLAYHENMKTRLAVFGDLNVTGPPPPPFHYSKSARSQESLLLKKG